MKGRRILGIIVVMAMLITAIPMRPGRMYSKIIDSLWDEEASMM